MNRIVPACCFTMIFAITGLITACVESGAAPMGAAASTSPPGGAADPLNPGQPYTARPEEIVTYDIDFSAVVTAPYKTKVLKVWLPIPQSDAHQTVSGSRLSSFPDEVKPQIGSEPVFGNKFAYFEFHKPEGAQMIRHRFRAAVAQARWNMEPAKVATIQRWPASFDPYFRSQENVVGSDDFKAVIDSIGGKTTDPHARLFGAMDWVDRNMAYDHINASLKASADHAFTQRRGHCSDYHGLCSTMGRMLGTPTRMTYGINLFAKNSPSHCKMEAFLPPYGWVSFDISETQKMVEEIGKDAKLSDADKKRLAAAARDRLKSGFRDNTWLLLTKGLGYDLIPASAKPVRVVRTIYAEADGVPLADPDPANTNQREYSWMTLHRYTPDRKVSYPFKDIKTLEAGK